MGLVLGLLGLGIGTAAWFRAAPKPEASYSGQEVADAQKAVCDAYTKGLRSLQVAGGKKADPADWLPVAVNTRLAEVAMSSYLIDLLEGNPAVPSQLQEPIHQLALNYQEMAVIQLADASPPDFEPNRLVADGLIPKINQICQ